MKYSIKRFSSPYSKDYENKTTGEYLDEIDSARRGKEIQSLDEEAERIRWRSSLDKYDSRKGSGAAILGGPGGIAGKWVGDKVADVADKAGKSDDDIKDISNAAGVVAGIGAGIGAGYAIKRGVGDSADATIKKATEELNHFEKYRKDVPKYNKMSKAEKTQITQEINRRNQIIRNAQKRSNIGKYAMPVLGAVGAIAAAKAVNDSVSDRLDRRKAIDSENRRKKESQERWDNFKNKAAEGLRNTGRYVKSIVTGDYRKDKKSKKKED